MAETKNIWEELRKPFPDGTVGKLPKPTRSQTDEVKANFKAGIRCKICGAWHHPDVVHLDYIGHAAVTDRLNTLVGPENWSLDPIAYDANGNPVVNSKGELWCRLTIMEASKLCVGDGDPSSKVLLGDALRNGAMRFGVALDLWSKDELESNIAHPENKNIRPSQQAANEHPKEPARDLSADEPISETNLNALVKLLDAKGIKDHVLLGGVLKRFALEMYAAPTIKEITNSQAVELSAVIKGMAPEALDSITKEVK